MARLNPGFIKAPGSWGDPGAGLLIFLSALVSSCWVGSFGFKPREIRVNSLSAYYWLLCCMMLSEQKHGRDWETHFLPLITVRNLLMCLGHAAHSVTFWPQGLHFQPSWREERLLESHFSRIKARCRGTPSLKEGWLGTYYSHLEGLRSASQPARKAQSMADPISMEEATSTADLALKSACRLAAATTVNQTPDQIEAGLWKWWAATGHGYFRSLHQDDWLTSSDDGLDNDLETEEIDVIPIGHYGASEDVRPDAMTDKLLRAEDTVSLEADIEALAQVLCNGSAASDEKEVLSEGWDSSQAPCPRSLPDILALMEGPEWKFGAATSHGQFACFRRVSALLDPMKLFSTHVRLAERVLSRAQVLGMKPAERKNEWNWVMHQLAQARQNAMFSAARSGRCAGWFAATQSLCAAAAWLLSMISKSPRRSILESNYMICVDIFACYIIFCFI